VRITGARTGASGRDVWDVADSNYVSGGVFGGGGEVVPSTDAAGNGEAGRGLSLHFGSPSGTGFAPGQLWEVVVKGGGVTLAAAPGTVEFRECSGRGQCSLGTGLCTCFDGFMGATCETRTDVKLIRDGDPGFLVSVEDALFTGDVLRLTSGKLPSPDFYFLEALAGGQRVFGVRGDGTMAVQMFSVDSLTVANGLMVNDGGITLNNRGLTVNAGGIDVNDGGARIRGTSNAAPALDVTADTLLAGGYSGGPALRVELREPEAAPQDDALLIDLRVRPYFVNTSLDSPLRDYSSVVRATSNLQLAPAATSRFSVSSTGTTRVPSGGLIVGNPGAASPDGPVAARAAAGGAWGGAAIAGGLTVADYGVDVRNGGLRVVNDPRGPRGHWPNASGGAGEAVVDASARDVAFSGTVLRGSYDYGGGGTAAGGANGSDFSLLYLTNGAAPLLRVDGTGFTEVYSGGLAVDAGGAVVKAGGLSVLAGGAIVHSGGVSVMAGGLQVAQGGGVFSINGENAGGVSIVQSGVPFTESMLDLQAGIPDSSGFNFIRARAAGRTLFRVDGLGDMYLGATPSGDPRVRIASNGYIQTLQHDDVTMAADAGQTVFVSAGDAWIGGTVGSIFVRGGNGAGVVRGGDISLAGGHAEDADAGNVVLAAGDILPGSVGARAGSVSVVPGQGDGDSQAGVLELLDGRPGTRSVVFRATPGFVTVGSGGDLSLFTSSMPSSVLDATTAGNLNVRAGGWLTEAGGAGVSIYGGPSNGVAVQSDGAMSLWGGTYLVGAAPTASLVGDVALDLESRISVVVQSGSTLSLLANDFSTQRAPNVLVEAQFGLSLAGGASLMASGGLLASVSSPVDAVLSGGNAASLFGGAYAVMESPALVSFAAPGGNVQAFAATGVSLWGGARVDAVSGADAQLAANGLLSLFGNGALTVRTPGALSLASAADSAQLTAGGSLLSLAGADSLVAAGLGNVAVVGGNVLSLAGTAAAVLMSEGILSLASGRSDAVVVSGGHLTSISAANVQLTSCGLFRASALDMIEVTGRSAVSVHADTSAYVDVGLDFSVTAGNAAFIRAPTALRVDASELSLHAGSVAYIFSEDVTSLYAVNVGVQTAGSLLSFSAGDQVQVAAGNALSLVAGTDAFLQSTNNVLVAAPAIASLQAGINLQLRGGERTFLSAGQYVSVTAPLSLLSQTAGTASHFSAADMFHVSEGLQSITGQNTQLDSAGLLSISAGMDLMMRGWQQSSLYATQEVNVATAGLLALRGSGFASVYGGNSFVAGSPGMVSVASANEDVWLSAGTGVSIFGPSSMGLRTDGMLRAQAGVDLLATAVGVMSLAGGPSLLASTTGQLVGAAGGMVSLAAGTNLWMKAFSGGASLTAAAGIQLRAGDALSMFGTNSIVGVAAGPLSMYSNEEVDLASDGVLSVTGANSLLLTSPAAAYLASSGGPVSVGAQGALLNQGADVLTMAVHSVSMYGPDAVLARSTTLASVYSDTLGALGSGIDALLFGGATATVSTAGAAALYGADFASVKGQNSLVATTEGPLLVRAGDYASLFGTNSFIVNTLGDLYASTSTGARVDATDIALYAASSLNLRAEIEADISSNTLRLLGNWLLDATANGPALLRSSADMVSIMSGGGSVIVSSPAMVSLAAGDAALLSGFNFASLSGGGSLALDAGALLTANSNGNMALHAAGTLSMNAAGGALQGTGTSLSFFAATDGTVAAYQTLSLSAGTLFTVNTPSVSIHGGTGVVLDTFGDTSLAARGVTNVWSGSSLLASTGCGVFATAPHTSLYGGVEATLFSPALATVGSNALVSIGGSTASVVASMGVDLSAPTDGTGSITASATTLSLYGGSQAELRAGAGVAALISDGDASLFARVNLNAASMGATSIFSQGDTVLRQFGGLHIAPTADGDILAAQNFVVAAAFQLSLTATGTALLSSASNTQVSSGDMTSLSAASSLMLQSGLGPISLYSPQDVIAYADKDVVIDSRAATV